MHKKYQEASKDEEEAAQEEESRSTNGQEGNATQDKNGIKTKRAAITVQHLRHKKANYGLTTEIMMEEVQEETKDRRTIEDKIDKAITAKEAVWAAAEEAERNK
eukprot:8940872-Ditylum_brightwellii.AAC.1